MALDLFDRRIDVTMFDSSYNEVAKVFTPEIGSKPEIKVEGNIISNTYAISSKVTITNIERSVPVESVRFLYVELYYGGAKTNAIKKGFLYDVLYADQSKQPPDRQVCFNCVVAGTSPNIMQQRCSIGELDAEGNPIEQTLDTLLRTVIAKYNLALVNYTHSPLLYQQLTLQSEPLYRMANLYAEKYKNKVIAYQCANKTLSEILDDLASASIDVEALTENESIQKEYYALNFYTEQGRLVVATNPSSSAELLEDNGVIDFTYVISAYRCGVVLHCATLFDPRIHQDITIRISRNAVIGKKVAGELLPMQTEVIRFRPVGGIKFSFSTTNENIMQMQGVAYPDNSSSSFKFALAR